MNINKPNYYNEWRKAEAAEKRAVDALRIAMYAETAAQAKIAEAEIVAQAKIAEAQAKIAEAEVKAREIIQQATACAEQAVETTKTVWRAWEGERDLRMAAEAAWKEERDKRQ